MSTSATTSPTETPFTNFLKNCSAATWSKAISQLLPSIHEVDRNATRIWFAFYPLDLFEALAAADNREKLVQELLIQGDYRLETQIDTSHQFLYGHRYWPHVKQAVERHAEKWAGTASHDEALAADLAEQIRAVAADAVVGAKADISLLIGITAVAFMTLRQVGVAAFRNAAGKVQLDKKRAQLRPDQILKDRAKDDSQGLLGFLKTIDKKWTVVFDENDNGAKYKLNNLQDLAGGAAEDRTREWAKLDPRRIEGPIPVECRSASCGTCWVGVLGGSEKLAPVATREGKKIKEFGYINADDPKPLIRLACQALAEGAVSIVIPPWNGVFGKYLKATTAGRPEEEVSPESVN